MATVTSAARFRQLTRSIAVLLPLFIAFEFLYFVLYRKINLDEGWYLWASKLVYEGQLLYRDFAYTQTPLLPYVYGAWQLIAGEGVLAGRLLTSLFGGLSILTGGLIVHRRLIDQQRAELAPLALAIYGFLSATSFYAMAYLTYTATYGLACFLLTASFLFASRDPGPKFDVISAALLSLAVATRLSVLPALPVLLIYRLMISNNRLRSFAAMLFVCGAIFALVSSFLLFSGSQMMYDIFGFHTDRIPSMTRQMWRMAATVKNSFRAYGVLLGLTGIGAITLVLSAIRQARIRQMCRSYGFECTMLLAATVIFLIHLWPRTTDAYYNTVLFPLWTVLGTLSITYLVDRIPGRLWLGLQKKVSIIIILSLLIGLHTLLQMDATRRNDLARIPPRSQLQRLAEAGTFLNGIDRVNNQLLTLNTHLALESGMSVPSGYEMSIFAYRPDWTVSQARRYKVVNNQMLIADIENRADAVAITDFDRERFYGERQRIFGALVEHYRLAKTIPGFDPFYQNLYIYLPPQFGQLAPQVSQTARLDQGISLLGYDLITGTTNEESPFQPGEQILVGLYWTADSTPQHDYTTFLHLLDPDEHVVAGWDNPPCRGTCPTSTWQAGERLRDEFTLTLPAEAASGTYRLRTGMYHTATGEALPVISAGESIQDGRLIYLSAIDIQK